MISWKEVEMRKCIEIIDELKDEHKENTFAYDNMMAYYVSLINTKTFPVKKNGKH